MCILGLCNVVSIKAVCIVGLCYSGIRLTVDIDKRLQKEDEDREFLGLKKRFDK